MGEEREEEKSSKIKEPGMNYNQEEIFGEEYMKNEINTIINKKWFWYGLGLPIIITFIQNLGIIFSIPNQFSTYQNDEIEVRVRMIYDHLQQQYYGGGLSVYGVF